MNALENMAVSLWDKYLNAEKAYMAAWATDDANTGDLYLKCAHAYREYGNAALRCTMARVYARSQG